MTAEEMLRTSPADICYSASRDRTKWDGPYVARRKGDALDYADKVDRGFDKASAADLRKMLDCRVERAR